MKKLWNNSLVAKSFLSYFAVAVVLFVSFYFFSSHVVKNLYVNTLGSRLDRDTRLLARTLPFDDEGPALDALCAELSERLGARITIIAPDGRVLGDSAEESSTMENHANRPEIIETLAHGAGMAVRYSTTVGYDLLYRASMQSQGDTKRIVRLALPLEEIQKTLQTLRQTLFTGLLVVSGVGLCLAFFFSRHISRRIRHLTDISRGIGGAAFPQNVSLAKGKDEIQLLEQALSEMGARIRDDIQQIKMENEKIDSILRCMVEGVLVLDPRGRVLLINDQARNIFNVAAERDVQGVSIAELSRHPEMRGMLEEIFTHDFSHQLYTKEIALGHSLWLRVNVARLTDGQQGELGLLLVFHDNTEMKRLEATRADFVANVSHELRTPLTAIRGYVETLLNNPPKAAADSRHFLEIIDRHSARLSRLTEDLLTLSDLESGRIQLVPRILDPAQLIQRTMEVFWDRAAKKDILLTHEIQPGLPALLGDMDRLQQLFINLIDNAVKYSPPTGQVTISARFRAATNGHDVTIQFAVADSGQGIPEKDLPRLTERFYRVDKARSRDLGGTGLGLAIVKHIVQAHGGELKIESTIGKGTTVYVSLPCAPPETQPHGILFLCTANSCRSQMAEGFARPLLINGQTLYSAGSAPTEIHPLAVQVMQEVGIDISGQRAKGIETVPVESIDLVVTLCGEDNEICPALPARLRRLHWPLPDPARAQGEEEEVLQAFREVRDEIAARVRWLLSAASS